MALQTRDIKTTKEFYANAGYTQYLALDVNTRMDAVVQDLNHEVDVDAIGQFDLVTDNGTGEHLFNQLAVWKNHHDLTKVGGAMLKIMPYTPWCNHGFYNFNPIIYRDVAAANDYKWLFFWIVDRDNVPIDLPHQPSSFAFIEKRPRVLLEHTLDPKWKTDLYMVAAWVRTNSRDFQIPLQGKYLKDIGDDHMRGAYAP